MKILAFIMQRNSSQYFNLYKRSSLNYSVNYHYTCAACHGWQDVAVQRAYFPYI